MDEGLSNVGASQVDVLDDFRHNVFALRQLEDVLLAVDDLQGAVGLPLADVTWQLEKALKRPPAS